MNQTLTDYQRGYLDGLKAYAWWKSGVGHVGTCGQTYEAAAKLFMSTQPPSGLHEPALLAACKMLSEASDFPPDNEADRARLIKLCTNKARAAIAKAEGGAQ